MSDQTSDTTLGDETERTELPEAFKAPAVPDVVQNILDLDEVLNSARLVERTAVICLRADLEADFDQMVEELASLVDENGTVIGDPEGALYDGRAARAQELRDRLDENVAERRAASREVRFRSLPTDEWEAFEKTHRGGAGNQVKDPAKYSNELISRCAIAPVLTVAEVQQLRKTLGPPQFNTLFNTAHDACTSGGLDVPKLPPFSVAQKRQG